MANLSVMRCKGLLGMLWLLVATVVPALEPKAVAVLYNSADPDSKELAEVYAKARAVPAENLVGLEMPKQAEITRDQYNETIAKPLRKVFNERKWWKLENNPQGVEVPTHNRIRVLLTMRGVPLKIRMTPPPDGKPMPDRKKQPFKGHDEASVDSELALLGVGLYQLEGAQRNPYFKSDKSFDQAGFPELMLTARIDAPTLATCKRMIADAVEIEQEGLWGMHYLDLSKKYPQGDNWLEGILKRNLKEGFPTVIDRFRETFPEGYPMTTAACYYGWYDWNLSGPMKSPRFRFLRGAVAIHIHSFSAQQLRDPAKNWSAGLLERGAAVTVGNVYEPYLGLTHHLDVLHERLLEGRTWVEACWMAMPATSWQGITLGDPLYRPFSNRDQEGDFPEYLKGIHMAGVTRQHSFRAFHDATQRWGDQPEEREKQIEELLHKMPYGVFLEAFGLEDVEAGKRDEAELMFEEGLLFENSKVDICRIKLHSIGLMRIDGEKDKALKALRAMRETYAEDPEVKAIDAWIKLLDPPKKPAE